MRFPDENSDPKYRFFFEIWIDEILEASKKMGLAKTDRNHGDSIFRE